MRKCSFEEESLRTRRGGRSSKMAAAVLSVVLAVFLCCCHPRMGFGSSVPSIPSENVEVTECELTTQRTLTVVKSDHFPGPYGSNVDCRYVIRRRSPATCSVTFLFNVLDLEASEECRKDFLDIHGEKLCGSKPIGFSRTVSFKESHDEVIMTFHSDNDTWGLGYMVTVVQQDCPLPVCDVVFKEAYFTLTSPNFPLPYDNGRNCKYTVVKSSPSVCRIHLKVRTFDVEEDERCASDFLEVNKERLCGTMSSGQIVDVDFPNATLVLEFQSDHVTTRDGFQFEAHQEECPTFTSTSALPSQSTVPMSLSDNTSTTNATPSN